MSYCRITATTIITVHDLPSLRTVWSLYGHTGLVKTFRCTKPLTETQRRRLPRGLREALAA